MLFTQLFNTTEIYIQINVKNKIIINNTSPDAFRLWLKYEAREEFAYIYQKEFNKIFGEYLTEENKDQLSYAGKNLVYAIAAYVYKKYDFEQLLTFVEAVITEQLDQFEDDFNIDWTDDEGQMRVLENPNAP